MFQQEAQCRPGREQRRGRGGLVWQGSGVSMRVHGRKLSRTRPVIEQHVLRTRHVPGTEVDPAEADNHK